MQRFNVCHAVEGTRPQPLLMVPTGDAGLIDAGFIR